MEILDGASSIDSIEMALNKILIDFEVNQLDNFSYCKSYKDYRDGVNGDSRIGDVTHAKLYNVHKNKSTSGYSIYASGSKYKSSYSSLSLHEVIMDIVRDNSLGDQYYLLIRLTSNRSLNSHYVFFIDATKLLDEYNNAMNNNISKLMEFLYPKSGDYTVTNVTVIE